MARQDELVERDDDRDERDVPGGEGEEQIQRRRLIAERNESTRNATPESHEKDEQGRAGDEESVAAEKQPPARMVPQIVPLHLDVELRVFPVSSHTVAVGGNDKWCFSA